MLLAASALAQVEFFWTEPKNINPVTHVIGNDTNVVALQYNVVTAARSNDFFAVAGTVPVGKNTIVIDSLPNPVWAAICTVSVTNSMFLYSTNSAAIYIDTNTWVIAGQNFPIPPGGFGARRPLPAGP